MFGARVVRVIRYGFVQAERGWRKQARVVNQVAQQDRGRADCAVGIPPRLDCVGVHSLAARHVKLFAQTLPDLEVLTIELGSLKRIFRWLTDKAGLEHKSQRVLNANRFQVGIACFLEGLGVWAVARHAIVQAGAAGDKAFRLGIVLATNQPHELVHKIAMEPGGTEGALGNHPTRRKNYEVKIRGAGNFRG